MQVIYFFIYFFALPPTETFKNMDTDGDGQISLNFFQVGRSLMIGTVVHPTNKLCTSTVLTLCPCSTVDYSDHVRLGMSELHGQHPAVAPGPVFPDFFIFTSAFALRVPPFSSGILSAEAMWC